MIVVDLLFELLRYTLKKEPLSEQTLKGISQEDLKKLYSLSKKHDITHLVAYALIQNNLIENPSSAYNAFVHQERLAIFRYENINHQIHIVSDLFEREGIEHILLKGSVIRSFYPEPWMRTSCDIDVLVHEEDVDRATALLQKETSALVEGKSSYDVSIYLSGNVHLEIHLNLSVDGQNKKTVDVLSKVWENVVIEDGRAFAYKMTDEMYYFYHLAHMSKHFAGNGCGIRSFVDLWVLENIPCDKEKRLELAKTGDLDKFMIASVKMAKVWMDDSKPEEITNEIQEYILNSGVYGSMQTRTISAQNKKGGKFRYSMSRIFLSRKELATHYPVLNKRKWATPFYQIRRWFKLLFCGGVKRSVAELKYIADLPEERIKNTKKMMTELGLWNK